MAITANYLAGGEALHLAVSVALSAILFTVARCISLVTLGMTTALATEKTNRLWPSMTIHAGCNFMIWLLVVGLR